MYFKIIIQEIIKSPLMLAFISLIGTSLIALWVTENTSNKLKNISIRKFASSTLRSANFTDQPQQVDQNQLKKISFDLFIIIVVSTLFLISLIVYYVGKTSASNLKIKLFSEIYKDCSMNEVMHLSLSGPMYYGDYGPNLLLESNSDAYVIVPQDYNLQLLSFDNNQNKWTKEKNNTQYFPLRSKFIFGKNNVDHVHIKITPVIETKKNLRVVVHGHIYENGVETQKCAGAFADIAVTP
jgi:hypothetical protein